MKTPETPGTPAVPEQSELLHDLGPGIVFPLGKSTMRAAYIENGQVTEMETLPLPETRDELFKAMAARLVAAEADGAQWSVAGMPCPVDSKRQHYGPSKAEGPFHNDGTGKPRSFVGDLVGADSRVQGLLDNDPNFIAVANDGTLATMAAVTRYAGPEDDRILSIIYGTGNGGGLALRQPDGSFRIPDIPMEIGMMPDVFIDNETCVLEDLVSPEGIRRITGRDVEELSDNHPHWRRFARVLAHQVSAADAIVGGIDVAVVSGGIGIGRQGAIQSRLRQAIGRERTRFESLSEETRMNVSFTLWGTGDGKFQFPRVEFVPPDEAETFEALGGLGLRASMAAKA